MEREAFTIVNENEHDIVGEILRSKNTKQPCIIFSHGLLENRKANYIKTLATKYLDEGYCVVTYDSSNSFGESGGRPEDVTITQRVADLTRVINYAKRRSYVKDEKIIIFGHCYGAMAALAMEGFQHEVAALVLVSVPSGIEDTFLTRKSGHEMMKIRLKRYFHVMHDEKEVRINYAFIEDGLKIDMDRAARNLTTPALFIHGSEDTSVPVGNTKRMFDRAIGPKKFEEIKMEHEIKGAAITKIFALSTEFLAEHI